MKYDVLTSGYVSMDHILKISQPARVGYTSLIANADCMRIYYGGCSVNIAAALCKLGLCAMPLLRVGKDWEENGFKAFLERCGVPLEGTRVLENECTSTCYLVQDNRGEHIALYYPGSMDRRWAAPPDDAFFAAARYGVITVASKPDNRYFLDACKRHGLPVVFGMKDDFDAFPVEFLKEILLESSIIFMNETERAIIEELFGCSTITQLFALGNARIIVTTLGEKGSLCYEKQADGTPLQHTIPACSVPRVVDATGAGDAYMAGFLYGHLHGRPVRECCCLGAALSSFVLQDVGCCTCIPAAAQLEMKAQEIL